MVTCVAGGNSRECFCCGGEAVNESGKARGDWWKVSTLSNFLREKLRLCCQIPLARESRQRLERGRGRGGSCLNLAQVNTFWIFWLHLSVSKTSCISMRVDLPGILGNNGPFNNYWQRLRKISWFVGGGHINYFPKPKVEANNWSARR